MNNESQVVLTVNFRGTQTSRGSYEFYKTKTSDGIKEGVNIQKMPEFSKVSKQMILKEQFVEGAIQEPPQSMKMRMEVWKSIPENKRIGIHVDRLVHDLYPDRVNYSFEIV